MRRRGLRSAQLQITNYKLQNPQRGYILITLMLFVAMVAIALLTVLPRMKQQIQRDQEEELRHRGSSYMRAVQHFYKKFGRYPTRIEELENTNNIRFLRKRYKDPINGKDFKILHLQDVSLNNGPVLGQALGPGATQAPVFGPGGSLPPGLQRAASQAPAQGQSGSTDNSDNPDSGNSQSSSSSSSDSGSSSSNTSSSSGGGSSSGPGGTVFGGGPILGVASTSNAKTIREFDKKNHYKDWLFIYDPTSDRGGLLVGPWQTNLSGGLGGTGLGTPVQNMSQSPQGMGQPILQPVGSQPQGIQQTPQNPPQNPGDNQNQ